jgi:hypothetical protein
VEAEGGRRRLSDTYCAGHGHRPSVLQNQIAGLEAGALQTEKDLFTDPFRSPVSRVSRPRLDGDRDTATRPEEVSQVTQADHRVLPKVYGINGEDPVERVVEYRQLRNGRELQDDAARLHGGSISTSGLMQHNLRVIDANDQPVWHHSRQQLDRRTWSKTDFQYPIIRLRSEKADRPPDPL